MQKVTYADLFSILLNNCHLESPTSKQFCKQKRKQFIEESKKQRLNSSFEDDEVEDSSSSDSEEEEEEEEDDDDYYDDEMLEEEEDSDDSLEEEEDDKLINDLCYSLENECSFESPQRSDVSGADLSYILSSPTSLISGVEFELEMEWSSRR